MVKLSDQMPNTPFLMFTDRDIGGFKNYLTLTCGAQKKGNNEIITLPAVNYVNFISTKKQRITLTDEASLERKLKNYSASNHPRMRFFRIFFAQMRTSGGKTSLVTAEYGEIFQQINELVEHHEAKNVNLNATVSQSKEFIQKTCMLDACESMWFMKNKTKLEDYWVDGEMPHQVLNWICSMANDEFRLGMLPIQIMSWQLIPEYIPSSDESDIQFYQTNSGTYYIFKFDPTIKSVTIFMPNVDELIRMNTLKFDGIKPKYNGEKKDFDKMYRETLNIDADGCNDVVDIDDGYQDQDEFGDYADDEDSVIVDDLNMDTVNFDTQFNSGTFNIDELLQKTKDEKQKKLEKQMRMFQSRVNKYHNDDDLF